MTLGYCLPDFLENGPYRISRRQKAIRRAVAAKRLRAPKERVKREVEERLRRIV